MSLSLTDQTLLRDAVPQWHDSGLFWTCFSGQRRATCHCRGAGWVKDIPMAVNFMALKKSPWGVRGGVWTQERTDIQVSRTTSTYGWNSPALTRCVSPSWISTAWHVKAADHWAEVRCDVNHWMINPARFEILLPFSLSMWAVNIFNFGIKKCSRASSNLQTFNSVRKWAAN